MACPVGTPSSINNTDLLWLGFWSRLYFIVDPVPGPGTEVYAGAIADGALQLDREEVEVLGTTYPRLVEAVFPSRVSMTFTGNAQELRAKLLHFIVGDERVDSENATIYPGATCAFGDIDVSFHGERENCAGYCIEFHFWKARASGSTEIGGADEVVTAPLTINAQNDTNGDFGGSSSAPLGFVTFSLDAV